MLIINADDWGGWRTATDAALACHAKGRITSVSAMVFMEDSERGADLAKDVGVDAGLHLNFTQAFSARSVPAFLNASQQRIRRFLTGSRYAVLIYHPCLREDFRTVYHWQLEEFVRLYGAPPSHVDGHQHKHLCANVLLQRLIAPGQRVRRNFSFWPGEKSMANRVYRALIDYWLSRSQCLPQYFFDLSQCLGAEARLRRALQLAQTSDVEVMAHPERPCESSWLLGDAWTVATRGLRMCAYSAL